MKNETDDKKKLSLRELWKIPKYRAIIKLSLYGIIIVFALIYIKIVNNKYNNTSDKISLSKLLDNNYAYEIQISLNSNNFFQNYIYNGKILDSEEIIAINNEIQYYFKNNAYYIYKDNNYILTTKSEVYNVIDYMYLDINNIIQYIKLGTLYSESNNTKNYRVELKNIVLNYTGEEYIDIRVTENGNVFIEIDYTNLIREIDKNIEYCNVKLNYTEIGEITYLIGK